MSKARHRCASDVEGCFRRAVERGMLRRRKVLHEPDVFGPGKTFRILRASENELLFRKTMRRLDEELLQYSLTIRCVGSQIRKIGFVRSEERRVGKEWRCRFGCEGRKDKEKNLSGSE